MHLLSPIIFLNYWSDSLYLALELLITKYKAFTYHEIFRIEVKHVENPYIKENR